MIKRNGDIKSIYAKMDSFISKSYYHGMIVYPEGTRNLTDKPLPLKKGIIYYAYERNHPVQVIITKNKEYSKKKEII